MISSPPFNMASPGHCQSMYLAPSRPDIGRQRSNSLPVGLLCMNGEEAGMMFSAAERATARRRKIISVDTPSWMDGPLENLPQFPEPPKHTIKPSPLRQVTQVRESQPPQQVKSMGRALRDLNANQVSNGRSMSPTADLILKTLPISPISPHKRQVTTHSLKNYADGLFQFTQSALVAKVPLMSSPPQTPNIFEDVFSDELDSPKTVTTHSQRPSLESKFSDWSISTRDVDSRRSSLAISPLPVEFEAGLMSPDSFFAGFEETPRHRDVNRLSVASGYASSETYDPSEVVPLLSRPTQVLEQHAPKKEEFSYFANFDHYLDRNVNDKQPESLQINLSPIEVNLSPFTPPPAIRRRADTAIRIARSCSAGPTSSRFAHSSPTTPYGMSEQIPNWLVGAIG